MAKQSQLPQQPTKEKKYPSPYGTHDSMVGEPRPRSVVADKRRETSVVQGLRRTMD